MLKKKKQGFKKVYRNYGLSHIAESDAFLHVLQHSSGLAAPPIGHNDFDDNCD